MPSGPARPAAIEPSAGGDGPGARAWRARRRGRRRWDRPPPPAGPCGPTGPSRRSSTTTRPNPHWSSSTPSEKNRAQMACPRQRVGSMRTVTVTAMPHRPWSVPSWASGTARTGGWSEPRHGPPPRWRTTSSSKTSRVELDEPDHPVGMGAGAAAEDGVGECGQLAHRLADGPCRRPGPPSRRPGGAARPRRSRTGRPTRRPGSGRSGRSRAGGRRRGGGPRAVRTRARPPRSGGTPG